MISFLVTVNAIFEGYLGMKRRIRKKEWMIDFFYNFYSVICKVQIVKVPILGRGLQISI